MSAGWKFPLDGIRRHKLMTKAIAAKMPPIGYTDGEFGGSGSAPKEPQGFDAIVGVKFFTPFGRYTFYATEFDGDDTLYGYCVSPLGPDCDEWGYASLRELAEATAFGGVPAIERDMGFGGEPLRGEGITVGEAVKAVAV